MLIEKPETLTVLIKTCRIHRKAYLVATILGAFHFDLREALLEEPEIWQTAGTGLPRREVLDALMPKPCGEFLAAGKCFSASGKPTPALQVRLAVGRLEKNIVVFGPRTWSTQYFKNMKIEPFVEMDICYEKAFGGPGFGRNPLGTGYFAGHGGEREIKERHLPNIEHPGQLITSPSDSPDPVGIGPLGMDWPQRAGCLGAYDRKWLNSNWPWFPDDFDPKFFNAAPQDQQLASGYFKGDEPLVIEHMHSHVPRIASALPGLRTRCFITWKERYKKEEFIELPARLDTVWLFPNVLKGVLIWRAVREVADEDAEEVSSLVVGLERLTEAPRKPDFYRERPDRQAPGESGKPTDEGSQQRSGPAAEPVSQGAETTPDPAPEVYRELEKQIAEGESAVFDQLRKLGLDPEKLLAGSAAALAMAKGPEAGAFSLEDALQELARSEAGIEETFTKMGLDTDSLLIQANLDKPVKEPSLTELAGQLRESGAIDDETAAMLADSDKEVNDALREVNHQLEARKEEPADLEAVPETAMGLEETVPFTREMVMECLSKGESLAGRDLSGLDLSGLDFQGISLEGAILEKADLSNSVLTRANLSDAMLAGANLNRARLDSALLANTNLAACNAGEADFTGADLRQADLSRGNVSGAAFAGASLDHGFFEETVFKGAKLEGASAKHAQFLSADLSGVRFGKADVSAADFSGANLDGADFSSCTMPSTSFYEASGRNVRFTGAALQESRADKSTSFQKADFQQTDLSGSNWEGAGLDGAKFRQSLLLMADFSNCSLQSADFYRADAKQARFSGANLEKADMTSINLFRGDLSKARLVETDLKGSNLFDVEFLKAQVNKANFRNANLKRTKLADRKPDDER